MQVNHVARRVVRRLGLSQAAAAVAPGLRRSGAFDGLTGVAFTGWLAGGVEPRVVLRYGGEPLVSVAADIDRPDVVQAGVPGARGFAFPISMVEAALKTRFSNLDTEPRLLEVHDATGRPLDGPRGAISPADLLRFAGLGCAIQLLRTQVKAPA